jgi:hypothetical protein
MLEAGGSSQEGEIRYDDKRWPFVVVTFPPGEFTDAQLTEHLRDIDAYTTRGGPYGFVVDARLSAPPSAAHRRQIVAAMDANSRRDGARFVGVAIVLNRAPQRAVFKALLWLRQSSHPLTAVATVEEGLHWLRALEKKTASRS